MRLDLKGRLDRLSIPEPNSGCQLWIGTVTKSTGYGEIKVNGRKTTAHRAMWIAHHGEIPSGMVVLHKCDIRSCVNLDHLSVGSRKDNSIDMSKKKRGAFNKLTSEQRRTNAKRAMQTLGSEGRKARAALRVSNTTPERRSASALKGWTPERKTEAQNHKHSQEARSKIAAAQKAAWKKLTPEGKSARARHRASFVPYEKHSERSRKMWASMTPEARAEHSRKVSEGRLRMLAQKKSRLVRINLLSPSP